MDRTVLSPLQRNLYWIAILPLLIFPASGWLIVGHKAKEQPALFWAGTALFVAGIAVLWVALSSRYQRVAIGSKLDERELALRYRTSTAAYCIYAVITVLGCAYLQLAALFGAPTPAGVGWAFVLIGFNSLYILLPIIIMEWRADPHALEEE
jgi:hypothetical protein